MELKIATIAQKVHKDIYRVSIVRLHSLCKLRLFSTSVQIKYKWFLLTIPLEGDGLFGINQYITCAICQTKSVLVIGVVT